MNLLIDIHTHKKKNSAAIELLNVNRLQSNFDKFVSAGIHPWDLEDENIQERMFKLEDLCNLHKLKAIGEIGIDRAIKININKQLMVFRQQHALAEKHNLPVIVHCVKAWSDLLGIRKELNTKIPWVFHGYNGNLKTANQLIEKGCYLSFGHYLLHKQNVQQVFKEVPLDFVFFETDDSDEKIDNIYKKAADLRHICTENLKMQIQNNFNRVFGLV